MAKTLHGVIVIDKPLGPTSHDVVAKLRRTLGTRAVGHAGTLDPAASGVLVVAVGEATKLVPYLTADKKEYRATVTFGTSTTTLDAEGDVVARAPIPEDLATELRALPMSLTAVGPALGRALADEKARAEQIPPAFSAIKTGGRTAYELARRGEVVDLAARPITVFRIDVTGASATSVDLDLLVAKGFYVRALARDLGLTLGVPSHLSALRRIASGSFTLEDALPWSASCEELAAALISVERAAQRVLPSSVLSEAGVTRARHGKLLEAEHFAAPPSAAISAWFAPTGELVALGKSVETGGFRVERGFSYVISMSST
jgi:tRNA pseudouridine55 synthase